VRILEAATESVKRRSESVYGSSRELDSIPSRFRLAPVVAATR